MTCIANKIRIAVKYPLFLKFSPRKKDKIYSTMPLNTKKKGREILNALLSLEMAVMNDKIAVVTTTDDETMIVGFPIDSKRKHTPSDNTRIKEPIMRLRYFILQLRWYRRRRLRIKQIG